MATTKKAEKKQVGKTAGDKDTRQSCVDSACIVYSNHNPGLYAVLDFNASVIDLAKRIHAYIYE